MMKASFLFCWIWIAMGAFGQQSAYKKGALLYEKNCASCHQNDGAGVPRLIPPLAGAPYISGDKVRLIRILLDGLNEPITVLEEDYFSPMASFAQLKDAEIAEVLTYIRKRFGNGAGPVSESEVRTQRKKGHK